MSASVVRKIIEGSAIVFAVVFMASPALAAVIDFEDGEDGMPIASTIPGLDFTNTEGFDWVYGDWRTGNYNGPYPNGPDPTSPQYYSDGNFFAWLGEMQGTGVITFTAAYATHFTIGYSSDSFVYLEAYDISGTKVAQDSGPSNLDTGSLNYLTVNAPGMAYVMIHDSGNHWLVDNLDTDAVTQCKTDPDCDDGIYCDGVEVCDRFLCKMGTPVVCPDNGLFCDGTEFCDETSKACASTGDPCTADQTCNENSRNCDNAPTSDDDQDAPAKDTPPVKALGGCGN